MNAHSQIYMDETPVTMRRALTSAIALYDNCDSEMERQTVNAIVEGRAAFWTTSQYHNATSSALPYSLNAGVDIERALEAGYSEAHYGRDFARINRMRRDALDWIIPLNLKAATALSLAYSAKGVMRDEAELLLRAYVDMRKQPTNQKPAKAKSLPTHEADFAGPPSPADLLREYHGRVL